MAVAVLMLAVVVAGLAAAAPAATGELLRTIVPTAATVGGVLVDPTCGGGGPSVALVQGSKVGFSEHPALLVTSCFASGNGGTAKDKRATLYFLKPTDPLLDPVGSGRVITAIKTKVGNATTAPGVGWAQLALAPDKGVLLGCGSEGSLYTIDFNALNAVADGTTAFVKKPGATCDGLSWDPSNNSVYQAAGGTIFHFDLAGNALPSPTPASFPAGCTVNGLSVVGGVLLVSCDGSAVVRRLDKTSGAALSSYPAFTSSALDDLECDPVTFAAGNREALWSRNAATGQVQAFRVPAGTCGLPPKATVAEPAKCPVVDLDPITGASRYLKADGSPKDTDRDGLWDCWEDGELWADGKPGIDFDGDGTRDLVLCASVDTNGDGVPNATECADPLVKDLFVEIDYMANLDGSKSHKPDPLALLAVRNAFASAPALPNEPGTVRVRFVVDERLAHVDSLAFEPCTIAATAGAADFDAIKAASFGTDAERTSGPGAAKLLDAKRFAYRYLIFGHNLLGTSASGCAEVVGDDGAVTLASFGVADPSGHKIHTTDQEAGTLMHEIGHLLGLRHGGPDNVGCKPNYLSVMNYSLQFSDFVGNRPLDYSREALPTLDESALDEADGIGDVAAFALDGRKTVYSGPTSSVIVTLNAQTGSASCPSSPSGETIETDGPIDWNCSQGAGGTVTTDINKHLAAGCDGTGTVLVGSNDWLNLQFNARASLDFSGGIQEFADKTAEHEAASYEGADRDGNGVPDGFACDPSVACAIDVKPGSNPKVLSKGNEANIKVAILGSLNFDPAVLVVRETLRLNGILVKINNQGSGTCQVDKNGPFNNLVCQFSSVPLPLGRIQADLQGQLRSTPMSSFRARDFVTIIK